MEEEDDGIRWVEYIGDGARPGSKKRRDGPFPDEYEAKFYVEQLKAEGATEIEITGRKEVE